MYDTTRKIIRDFAFYHEKDVDTTLQAFQTFSKETGWEDWMNDYTDAPEGEELSEREREHIENVQAEEWLASL